MSKRIEALLALSCVSLAGALGAAEPTTAVASPAPDSVAAAFTLPAPTGPYAVGTTSWTIEDPARAEELARGRARRAIEVLAYYPAEPARNGENGVPYLRHGLLEVRPLFPPGKGDGPATAIGAVRTHARRDAPLLRASGRWPLIFFSAGFTGFPSSHAALLEDLASHGDVVLQVLHPYEVAAAVLPDGTAVSFLDGQGALRPEVEAVFAEWAKEDESLRAATTAADETAALAALRGYLAGLVHTSAVVARWSADTRLALDRLSSMPAGSIGAELAARSDASRVGAAGHSMGGVVAAQFCFEDSRCAAALNLDGSPQSGALLDAVPARRFPILMVYSDRPGRIGANDPIYRRVASRYRRVDVRGTLHLDFCDLDFWGGPLAEHHALGPIGAERAAELTRRLVLEYFDETLLDRRSPLLAGDAREPELTIREVPVVDPRSAAPPPAHD